MLNELKEWVEGELGDTYTCTMGMWVESLMTDDQRYCVIQSVGGPGSDVEDRRPRFRVVLLGRRNQRQDVLRVMDDVNELVIAGMGESLPCKAVGFRTISEPIGPGYTSENRAWAQIDFEILF